MPKTSVEGQHDHVRDDQDKVNSVAENQKSMFDQLTSDVIVTMNGMKDMKDKQDDTEKEVQSMRVSQKKTYCYIYTTNCLQLQQRTDLCHVLLPQIQTCSSNQNGSSSYISNCK